MSDLPFQKPHPYLRFLKIENFGSMANWLVGPFSPGLNVVFGRNETGKTTIASFVAGVLFGWEDARGNRNTYRPVNAERGGSLIFEYDDSLQQAHEEVILSRHRNADGLQGDNRIIEDIDKETYRTMFFLTSDELRSLRNTTDMTARLLTAGSGTGASPAQALNELRKQLSESTSRAASAELSVTKLMEERARADQTLRESTQEAERYRKEYREFHAIQTERRTMMRRLDSVNEDIEALTAARASLERIEDQYDELLEERERLKSEYHESLREKESLERSVASDLGSLSSTEELNLRDRIETYRDREHRQDQLVEQARSNYSSSKAVYEALLEVDQDSEQESRRRIKRIAQIVLSVLIPLILMTGGVPLFVYGRSVASFSFMALGLILVAFSLLMAGAALFLVFRADRQEGQYEDRINDAHWVMVQDEKKYEASRKDSAELAEEIGGFLDSHGLAEAAGSLRRALSILDDMHDLRSNIALADQRSQSMGSRLAVMKRTLEQLKNQRLKLVKKLGFEDDQNLEDVNRVLARRMRARDTLTESAERVNSRFGELRQELQQAQAVHEFDRRKMDFQIITTRLQEAIGNLVRLLLAKRMLEMAITSWESRSQPEVFRRAGEFLSLMTNGRWNRVEMSSEGKLQVYDFAKTMREPSHLSLGTCQQVYLSLRVALLMAAENVGSAIPVVADDILVHFDEERRRGAARVLLRLAQVRQVILFTCHQEIVAVLKEEDAGISIINL